MRVKNSYFKLAVVAIFVVFSSSLQAQPKKGLYGITVAIAKGFESSQNISTNTGSLNIGMAYLLSDQLSLRGELGFRSYKDTSGNRSSEFTFTANMWYYLQTSENVSTFLGGALGLGSGSDAAGNGTSLLSLNGFFGAEYWFSPHFSWYGQIGIVLASYTVAERPASDFFSSAATGLTWYL